MLRRTMLAPQLLSLFSALATPATAVPGEDPPPGPPWQLTYREARLDALAHGRPVFVYFTKTY